MASFIVRGPYVVKLKNCYAGRLIGKAEGKQFWSDHPNLEGEVGCYVFALKASKGMKPMYIGKATKSFVQEVFTDNKKNKYNEALAGRKKGKAILFFICLAKTKGPKNLKAIDEAELFLIQAGLVANKKILNDKKTKIESWSIGGVIRSGKGKSSESAKLLVECLKLV